MPLIFLGHGSPMNAIESNIYRQSWKSIGESITQKPRAILMFSAHWITEGETRINTTDMPPMIYDMYGFPPELYRISYNCPGSQEMAAEIIHAFSPDYEIRWDVTHGLDHGAWSTLIHAFPDANIPVIQLSLDYSKSPKWHYEFGKKLQLLREQWILIIASGNIVHNLSAIDWSGKEKYPWAVEFDNRVAEDISQRNYDDIVNFQNWGSMSFLAHPSYDHLLPLFPLLGAIGESDIVEFSTPDIMMGSLAMRSIVWR